MSCVFQNADTFIGNVEEDDRCTKNTARADDVSIKNTANANEQENQHLSTDTFEADLAGECVITNGTHDASDIVDGYKCDECVEQSIPTSEEVAEPAANAGKDELNRVPEFFH